MASEDSRNKSIKCTPGNAGLIIRKLVDLIDHPISGNANERNLKILADFLNASHYAFWLRTIPDIIRLYEIISTKLEKVPQFKEPFARLLHYSAFPPMLTKVSDQLEYARDFQEYFSTLGYLVICLHDEELSKLILYAIISLLEIHQPLGDCCVTPIYIEETVEKSNLPEILVQLILVVSDTLYPLLLEAILLVSRISKSTSKKMAKENAIEYLMRTLEPTWRTRDQETKPHNPRPEDKIDHVQTVCCILWNLLISVQNDIENICTPTSLALWSLQYAFRWSFVFPGHRTERNDLAAIILKLLCTFPQIEFVESGLVHDVTLLATGAMGQIRAVRPAVKDDETEFRFKTIILACLFYYKNYKVDKVVTDHNVMNALIKFLSAGQNGTVSRTHHCGLLKTVIRLIPEFVPVSVDNFLILDAPLQITSFISAYLSTTYDINVLEACMYCAHKSLRLDEDVLAAFAQANVSTTVALVCNRILDTTTLTHVHQKCIGRGFCILQIVGGAHHAVLTLCMKYLNRVVRPTQADPVLDVRITACALHSLWGCVQANDRTHSEFVEKGGAYVLLDVAEACTFPAQSLVLGIVADLLRRSLCVPYLITWRKRGRRLLPLLMEIFRGKTEKHCGEGEKKQFSSENIVDLCRGQRSTFQNYCVTQSEMLQSCRYKIHGIIEALKVKHKQKVALANGHYKLYSEKLNTDDELTMLFAENFLSLTMCETWVAMVKELEVEGFVPTGPDCERLRDKIDGIHQWKKYLQWQIEKKVADEMRHEKNSEYETYIQLNEARLTDALDALKQLRFVSTCTERIFQLCKKLRLSQEVEPLYKKNINYHRTSLHLPFTNIYDQTIKIQSDVTYYENENECYIAPASSRSESDFDIKYSEDELSEHGLEC